ncbi:MAG: threonine--tRNA ligase [Alphaproteobacteria bacterium]|jgi:threonyl-tRNA synthetase|nr:threonine--tRNA ligase [Alphaproteobacteria bacterium]MBT4085090.1 threonine--tRNA ligase [Alphaproteobacteria bacterium]MBT4546105.1 threonine--tRNA ligase [Alphaproteobacteria bacterium]
MVALTLPDGSVRQFDDAASGADLAADIGPGLAKAALAVRVDGNLWDLHRPIETDAAVSIVTIKDDDETILHLLRHDAAHILAEAAKELWPDIQVTIGPAIENGFYYDFSRAEPFTPEDLEKMEKRMHEIVDRDEKLEREVWDRNKAIDYFKSIGELYKAELISDLPEDEVITLYRQGEFVDLCLGPHLPSTKKLGHAFRLMKLAGAYWRGKSDNEMLQRVYGTAWRNEKELNAYLLRIEEAEKRDHRKLGKEMDLFHFQEEAAGMAFWHPKGWTLYRSLENYMRRRLDAAGYVEIKTPQLVDRMLWEASGHWEKYRENMYISESEDRVFALKPMNCPCHVQVFRQGLKSYRDLPLRMAEFGSCHRYEPSGALHGLMRVRGFVQDDAHIFCREEQIAAETKDFCDLLMSVYKDFGFTDVAIKFSDRPEVRAGTDEVWDQAEGALKDAVIAAGYEFELNPGDGAFYGPKLDFVLTDAIGREWQCGTLQADFVLPERLGASYIGEDSQKHTPVMLHRAILGSLERFTGILIEEYAGKFPLWLSPQQFVVCAIVSDADDFASEVLAKMKAAGLRGDVDLRNEKINLKVREHSLAKVPVIVAVGRQEVESGKVAVRRLGEKGQQILDLDDAIARLVEEAKIPGT